MRQRLLGGFRGTVVSSVIPVVFHVWGNQGVGPCIHEWKNHLEVEEPTIGATSSASGWLCALIVFERGLVW